MLKLKKNNLTMFRFANLSVFSEISHFVTSRKGGVSNRPFDNLNLGFNTDDAEENVLKNRQILSEAMNIRPEHFVVLNQIHGDGIINISSDDTGNDFLRPGAAAGNGDALMTNVPGLCLFLLTADCAPILFYDKKNKVIAAAHAGWRGTVKKIAQKTVLAMQEHYGSRPEDISAAIGPAISVSRYEVGDDVTRAVTEAFGTTENFMAKNSETGKMHFNLWYSNMRQLIDIGVIPSQIEAAGICTFNNPLFYSARQSTPTGRFGAGIILKN